LNPARKYSFKGGAIRGGTSSFSNRWSKVEIQGALSFTPAHSANVITSSQAPADLTTAQAAVLFAINNTAATGDIVDWENIAPSASGSFSIVCSQYKGFVPNGGSSIGNTNYAITGIRLEELSSGPPIITTQPANQSVNQGATATFTVAASGQPPLSYQWFKNGSMLPGATNASYTTPPTTFSDYGARFYVMVFNSLGNATSTNATLTVTFQPVVIMPLTNSWKYDQSGRNLGTEWQGVDYDDSSWPSGRGVLGLETDNAIILGPPALTNTVLSLFDPGQVRLITYYFRTHFNLGYEPTSISLVASNLIDDAAVYYLNGHEIYRQNIAAAPTRITSSTYATAAIEAAWTSTVIPAEFLVQGDNVLAVEVHQGGTASSDIDFGMSIRGDIAPPSALAITSNPSDRSVSESASATFTVGYSGTQPGFQWYKWINDVPVLIPGATRPSYTITNTALGDAGYYFVIVSNVINSVSSGSALLTVSTDLSGPTLVEADGTITSTNVTVSFSEFVVPGTATNIANYKITNITAGGTLTITKAVLNNATNVILTTSAPRLDSGSYLVIVNNVQDTTPHNNVIATNSSIPISKIVNLVALDASGWDFYNPLPGFDPLDPGVGWNQSGFVESSSWGIGQALFVYDPINREYPAARNTDLSNGAISSYFRLLFNGFGASPIGGKLLLNHVSDDGIVAYLNGVEVYRFNMPAGAITYTTPADTAIGQATLVTAEIPISAMRAGTNLLAVELHQMVQGDGDLVFGAGIQAEILSYSTGAVLITQGPKDLTVTEGQPFQFNVMGAGAAQIQWKTNGTAIPGATNPILSVASAPANWDGKLFSVTLSNPTATTTSTNARLTVLTDTTPPTLLSALMVSSTTISANFSEPITALTATNPANYRVTNSQGPNLTVSSGVLNNGTNVLLTVSTINPGTYTLVVNNIRDASTGNNRIASNSIATVGFSAVSFPFDASWQYRIDGVDLNQLDWSNL